MRIGISLLGAKRERTGIENVTFNLLQALSEIDDKNEYVIFTNRQSRDGFSLPAGRFGIVNVKLTFRRCVWLWEHLFFHLDPRRRGLDLVHFPLLGGVVGYRGKNVLTIHDLNDYWGRYNAKLRQRLLCVAWYKTNIPRANMVVTVSQEVKNQILKHFAVAPNRVRVVYNGVDERFKPLPKSASFKTFYHLPSEYILFVGSSYGNKNIRRMIEAFQVARHEQRLAHHLVIAGGPGNEEASLQAFVEKNGLGNVVHFVGYFPDQDLPKLYNHAALFVFPALSEGFGLPPLEAMACGTPVVASDIPVLREVLGESALFVDPYSVQNMASGPGGAQGAREQRGTEV
jgi:glycosyltransferase involved in cell wall biosynthesis